MIQLLTVRSSLDVTHPNTDERNNAGRLKSSLPYAQTEKKE